MRKQTFVTVFLSLAFSGPVAIAAPAFTSKHFDTAELMEHCRSKDDKQAVIAACTAIINNTRDKQQLERAHNRRGLAYEALKQFPLAIDDFGVVIRLNPKIAGYFDNRQRALVGLGRLEDALSDANTAVRMAPDYPFVYHGRGAIYGDMGRYDLAVRDFTTALGLNPNDAPLLVDRGKVFKQIGMLDNAMADFNSAHSIDPSFIGALRERGLLYLATGQLEPARDDLAQVVSSISADQQDPEVVSAMQRLSPASTAASQQVSGPALAFSEQAPASSPIAVPSAPSADEVRRAAEQALAEQRRKAAQEAEAARQAAAAKLRDERLARASTSARQAIDEASAFIKADPDNAKVLDYVQEVAELNSGLSPGDPDDIESKMATLGDALQHDGAFIAFRQRRADERQKQNARYLADAVRTLTAQKAFMVKAVTKDPTASSAPKLLQRIRDTDAALVSPSLDPVQTVMGRNDATLQEANLASEFAAEQKLAEQVASAQPVTAASSSEQARTEPTGVKPDLKDVTTEKNAFLLKGDLKDVVFLFNTSPRAPHVIKNLRGEIVFGNERADVCVVGPSPEDSLAPLIKSTLSAYGTAKTVVVAGETCEPDRLTTYDVIVARRGTFLRQAPQQALDLVKAIEMDQFQSLVTVTDTQVQAATAADAVTATEIATDVEKGTKTGYGVLLLAEGPTAVCLVAADHIAAHDQLLLAHGDKLAADMGTSPVVAPTTAEGAFVSAKHGQCGAILASEVDLKDIASGLKRDGVTYRFSSLWFTPEELKAADEKLQAEKALAAKQALDRQRQQAEAERLAAYGPSTKPRSLKPSRPRRGTSMGPAPRPLLRASART